MLFSLLACCAGSPFLCVAAAENDEKALDPTVAATAGEQSIYVREVEHALNNLLRGKQLAPEALSVARRKMLEQLVDQELVVRALQRSNEAASVEDVDFAMQQLVKQLKARDRSLAEYVATIGLAEADVRRELAWKLSWQAYLDRHLTPENLQKYFDRHRRDFDGTQVQVAHILLKADDSSDDKLAAAKHRAASLLSALRAGKITFADAARRHSQAPSGQAGGNIGYIERRHPMPESFSEAAFGLEPGQISEPVVTAAGVHLIQCLEIKPGQRTWQDAGAELQQAATQFLFRRLADRERKLVKVQFRQQ